MNKEFIARVGKSLAKLHTSFPHVVCSVPATLVWAEAFSDVPIEEIEQAVREYIRGETKTPTPADIRLRAKDNIEAKRKAANSVKIRGVTYHTNPPDFEKEARDRESARRWLERHRDQVPTSAKPVQPTPEQIRQDRENIKQKIEQFRQQMGLSKGAE